MSDAGALLRGNMVPMLLAHSPMQACCLSVAAGAGCMPLSLSARQPSGAPCSALHGCTLAQVAWTRDTRLQGMLPAIAPVLAHMAEDAWEHLPWPQPKRSVFEAGWFQAPQEWHQMPEVRQLSAVCHSLLEVASMPPGKLHEACPLHRILNGPTAGLP